jgi:hypothetical protein
MRLPFVEIRINNKGFALFIVKDKSAISTTFIE